MNKIKRFENVMWGDKSQKPYSKEELLRRSRVEKIDEFDSYFKNLKILKSYINTLEKTYEINKIMLSYAIILHNFIILERYYIELVEKERYEINKYLDIVENDNSYGVSKKLIELYDPEHKVRNNVEAIDRLKPIDDFLKDNPEIYKRVFTEDEIDMLI